MSGRIGDGRPSGDDDDERPKYRRDKSGIMRAVDLLYEFDCPECDANNPWEDGFKEGDEVRCHYCQQELRVASLENGKVKWKLV